MKKLMIAAAAAVVGVSVASATDFVYDFDASVKTTTGAEGKDTKEKFTVNLGKNDTGKWWYDDELFTATADGKFKNASNDTVNIEKALKAGNSKYPWKLNTSVVKTDEDKAALAAALGFNEATGVTTYNVQKLYKGKLVWCETFKYEKPVLGSCYRKSTSLKFKGKVNVEDCCDDTAWEVVLPTLGTEDVTVYFINRFGAQTLDKADDVEGLFSFGDDFDAADGTNFGFALAGQGSWSEKAAKYEEDDVAGITKMSGNIVGFLPAPNCETCCADEAAAIAWECDSLVAEDDLPTAAYGTWSIKVNKKESFQD